jgi:hypothetical protein
VAAARLEADERRRELAILGERGLGFAAPLEDPRVQEPRVVRLVARMVAPEPFDRVRGVVPGAVIDGAREPRRRCRSFS